MQDATLCVFTLVTVWEFRMEKIVKVTEGYSPSRKLGGGGFSTVY